MDYYQRSLAAHIKAGGKLKVESLMPVTNPDELSLAYTPGVAEPVRAIVDGRVEAREVVATKNMVAVVTDGSAVLGLGDVGPTAALPVMEGKAVLFKAFAGVEAWPIAVDTQDVDEFVQTVVNIAPTFGGINLEDIAAPRCFAIEEKLKKKLDIPVFHDDQHGTAIVVLAGLINSLLVVNKSMENVTVAISGAGAAGIAVAKLLHKYSVGNIIVGDSQGILSSDRDGLNSYKQELVKITNKDNLHGDFKQALKGADVFIGVSKGSLLGADDIKTMQKDAIVFAMSNPEPEIMPDLAKAGGAKVVATGRSDFPNQLNNVLAFPGIFKGALEAGIPNITDEMKLNAAKALADLVENPTPEKIIPSPFDEGVAIAVAKAVSM